MIDGIVDFWNLIDFRVNLFMLVENYMLFNVFCIKESLVYGKVFVDFNVIVCGLVNVLVMCGNMNLLGNMDVIYVLMDLLFIVQDWLGDLVIFIFFSDMMIVQKEEVFVVLFGGFDMIMIV